MKYTHVYFQAQVIPADCKDWTQYGLQNQSTAAEAREVAKQARRYYPKSRAVKITETTTRTTRVLRRPLTPNKKASRP